MLIIFSRFLWVDLLFKAILDACEEDGTPDGIPHLFERPPRKVTELYNLALIKLSSQDGKLGELAKKVFQWVICSRRPLTICELEEAISITTDQKSWRIPPFKLVLAKLCRMCGNLVKYDTANEAVSLAHHTVLSFLLHCSNTPGISKFAFEEDRTEQYLADICLTYLSFTNFCNAVVRTTDTTYVRALNQPMDLVSGIVPRTIQTLGLRTSRSGKTNKYFDLANSLRLELSAHQSMKSDPSFQLLEYCKTYWHEHSRCIEPQNAKRFTMLEIFVQKKGLPPVWRPWSTITGHKSLPHWKMFIWAVREGHAAIFHIWQNAVTTQAASYWSHFWLEEGQRLFASACATANLEQLNIILSAKRRDKRVLRPSVNEISHGLVRACHSGHNEVVERLLQEKADVNAAAAAFDGGRTALQAAAGGGHLAVVERLLQEKANVNAAAASNGRTALQAAAEGGHLAVVERLLQEKANVNAAAASNGRTALQAAAEGGHLAVVERLLQEKADINAAAASNGRTALQTAAGGHTKIMEHHH